MSFPRYPSYKDSGIERINAVPKHWTVAPLKRCAKLRTEKTDRRTNPVALENIDGWSGRLVPTESDFQGDGVAFQPGDILFGKLRPYLAKVYLAEAAGEAVGDFHVISPREGMSPRYLQYQMLTREFIDVVDGSTFGSKMPRASWDFMGPLGVVRPPKAEQDIIATFLNRETAKIDALVAEQERLISLLKEKRQAVVSHAVTKGLNPDAPMKQSGIEWLGDVPAHWGMQKLKYLGRAITGLTYSPNDVADEENGTLVLRASNVQDGRITNADNVYVTCAIPKELVTKPGDVLICSRSGSRALIGKNAMIDADWAGVTFGAFMTVFRSEINQFLYWIFNSSLFEFQSGSFLTSTINQLTIGTLNEFAVPLPPQQERDLLTTVLASQTASFDRLLTEANSAIEFLKERRSALISAAVTGQIDIRGLRAAA